MDIETYMREAARFDNHRDERLLDALVHGVAAEVGEVMACMEGRVVGDDLLHELGDVMWNLIRLVDELGYEVTDLLRYGWGPANSEVEDAYRLPHHALKLSGVMEKWCRIPLPPWPLRAELAHHLHGAWQAVANLGYRFGFPPARVMQANIDKLTARYAERGLPTKETT